MRRVLVSPLLTLVLVLASGSALATGWTPAGTPNLGDRKGEWPAKGWGYWAGWNDRIFQWITEDAYWAPGINPCKPELPTFAERIKNGTASTPEFGQPDGSPLGPWPSGIRVFRLHCPGDYHPNHGDWAYPGNIYFYYYNGQKWTATYCADEARRGEACGPNTGGGRFGGENKAKFASKDLCHLWVWKYPCGYSHVNIILNHDRYWVNGGMNADDRVRNWLHETGHSFGLADYCGANSIMNTGQSGKYGKPACNGARWRAQSNWEPRDRLGVKTRVYTNFLYPHVQCDSYPCAANE
jgi:hypothetical protein